MNTFEVNIAGTGSLSWTPSPSSHVAISGEEGCIQFRSTASVVDPIQSATQYEEETASTDHDENQEEEEAYKMDFTQMDSSILQQPLHTWNVARGNSMLLAWTPTAYIASYTSPDLDHAFVHIIFADETNRNVKFRDEFLFVYANFDATGAVFISRATEYVPSYVYYQNFQPWTNQKPWYVSLPHRENAILVANGLGWCAVGFDNNAIRIYSTVLGSLKMHFQVDGPLLAMAGDGKWLMLLYHTAHGCIQYVFRYFPKNSVKDSSLERTGFLPTSTTLRWVGFTDDGVPVILTARNVLLTYQWQEQSWWPLDLCPKGKFPPTTKLYPIGFVQSKLLHLILPPGQTIPELRGKKLPIPNVLDLLTLKTCVRKWKIVAADHEESMQVFERNANDLLADRTVFRMQQEDSLHRSTLCDKLTLIYFKELCINKKVGAAWELISDLRLDKSKNIAKTIASHYNLHVLTNKMDKYN